MTTPKPLNAYISYAFRNDQDSCLCEELNEALIMLQRSEGLEVQYAAQMLDVGESLEAELTKALEAADLVLVLLSSDYFADDFCYEEMLYALQMQEEQRTVLVPILLRPCDWESDTYLEKALVNATLLPLSQKAVTSNENLDEAFTEIAFEIGELIDHVKAKEDLQYLDLEAILEDDPSTQNTLVHYPRPHRHFTGRSEELGIFKDAYDNNNILCVEGIGGVGKTEFIAKVIEEWLEDKNSIFWINGAEESKLDTFIEQAGYEHILKGERSNQSKYRALLSLLERDRARVFVDNLHEITDPEFSEFIEYVEGILRKAKIIMISRFKPRLEVMFYNLELEGLRKKEALEYAHRIKALDSDYADIDENDLRKIVEGLQGHPLAIQLALELISYGISAQNIIRELVTYRHLPRFMELNRRLWLNIYNHPQTSQSVKQLLLAMSVCNYKVERQALAYISGQKNIFLDLSTLIRKNVINKTRSLEGTLYETHPLIREYCYEQLPDKVGTHLKAATYFAKKRNKTFSADLETKIFYHLSSAGAWEKIADNIVFLGRQFIEHGQLKLLSEMLNETVDRAQLRPIFLLFFGEIAFVQSNFARALRFYDKARLYESEPLINIEGWLKCGHVLRKMGNVQQALKCYEKSNELCDEKQLSKQKIDVLNAMGKAYKDMNRLEDAIAKHEEALRLCKDTQNQLDLANSLLSVGIVLGNLSRYPEALEKFEACLKHYKAIGNQLGLAKTNNCMGVVLQQTRQIPAAMTKFTRSLHISEAIGNKLGIAYSYQGIGTCYLQNKMDDSQEGLDYLKKAQQIFIEIGMEQHANTVKKDMKNAQIKKTISMKLTNFVRANYDELAEEMAVLEDLEAVITKSKSALDQRDQRFSRFR